jgi:hypothetical protein
MTTAINEAFADLGWLAEQGAKFALPYGHTKHKFEEGWPEKPHTFEEAITHTRSDGNVGILTGKHSGGMVAIDKDIEFDETVQKLGRFARTAKIKRTNAPDRGKFLYRVRGELPGSASWKLPGDKHPRAEFLSTGRHALGPGSEYDGGDYVLVNKELGILEVTPEELDHIWFIITGTPLLEQTKDDKEEQDKAKSEYIRKVKAHWDSAYKVFKHFNKFTEEQKERNGQIRLLGNGGLLVGDPNGDNRGQWFCFASDKGGGPLKAWCECKWNKKFDKTDKRLFWDVLYEMGDAAGIPKPEMHVNSDSNTTAPRPGAPQQGLAEVLQALRAIAADEKLQPKERKTKIGRELGQAIGNMDRAAHAEVITALVDAQADYTKTDAKDFVRGCITDAKARQKERQKEQRQQWRQSQSEAKTKGDRAVIQINDRQLDAVIYDSLSTIREQIKSKPRFPCVYIRGGVLARVATDEDGICTPELLNEAATGAVLSQLANWVAVTAGEEGEIVKDVYPPTTVSRTLLSWGSWPGGPPLDGVTGVPVFGKDGQLHDIAGYDAATRLFYPGGVKLGDTNPTVANVERSKALICDELLGEFPFKKDGKHEETSASKAHAIAMVLAPFVRPMIDGPTPLHLVDSPTPGTGKGLLTVACAYPALGYIVASTPAGKDDEEWRKRITSFLRNGSNFVLIDNVTMPLDSGVLASALTQPVWEDRILGLSQTVRVKVRCTWAATGNNVLTSKEIARRTIWIRLDANDEKPWDRNFKHDNLIQWCKANRDQLVTAAITLIRNWIAQGSKSYSARAKGSYPEWTAIIGGILQANGISGFLENEDELHKLVNSETETLRDFVLAWAKEHGKNKVGVKTLFELASYPDDPSPGQWRGLLDGQLGAGKQRARQTQLGLLLTRHRDTVIAGHKIVFAGNSNGQKYYSLVPMDVERVERVEPFQPDVRATFENFSHASAQKCKKNLATYADIDTEGSTRSTRSTVDSHSEVETPSWVDYESTWEVRDDSQSEGEVQRWIL